MTMVLLNYIANFGISWGDWTVGNILPQTQKNVYMHTLHTPSNAEFVFPPFCLPLPPYFKSQVVIMDTLYNIVELRHSDKNRSIKILFIWQPVNKCLLRMI